MIDRLVRGITTVRRLRELRGVNVLQWGVPCINSPHRLLQQANKLRPAHAISLTSRRQTLNKSVRSVMAEAIAWLNQLCRPAGKEATALRPTADELATLRAAGLEPRKGVPGLFLRHVMCRDPNGNPLLVPPDGIKLEGGIKKLADAMRDELATYLRENGTEGLPTTNFRGTERADLTGAWLQGADLARAQLQEASLCEAQLQKSKLFKAQLQKADLYKAQLQGSYLGKAELQGADLWKAQLQGANMSEAQLQGAILGGAQLQGANLWEANLQHASFVGAKLTGAILTQSELARTDFTSADLTKANLNQALESMRNYRPPHPPAALASSLWRSKSVAKSTAVAVYKWLTQTDDDGDDDDDSSGSEDEGDDEGEEKLAPWLAAAEEVAARAAGALVAVAQPVLLVVNST